MKQVGKSGYHVSESTLFSPAWDKTDVFQQLLLSCCRHINITFDAVYIFLKIALARASRIATRHPLLQNIIRLK